MDPNITGRTSTGCPTNGIRASKVAVLDVTDATHGNGLGIGLADFTTRRLVGRLDLAAMYANALTSTVVVPARIPPALDTEREVIQAAVKTCGAPDRARVRLARIRNTLHLGELLVSEALFDEARANPALTVLGEPEPMRFDAEGRLANGWDGGTP
jgi:hypothetical protein